MAVKCGLVGLPGVGKSVLFNAMTRGNAASGNFLFCTTIADGLFRVGAQGEMVRVAPLAQH